jgi:hypothetical protein
MDAMKLIHFISLMFLFLGFGLLISYKVSSDKGAALGVLKKSGSIVNGIGLLGLFVSGFGMMHRFSEISVPAWFWVKVGIWLCMGLTFSLIKRSRMGLAGLSAVVLILGAFAVWTVLAKPF